MKVVILTLFLFAVNSGIAQSSESFDDIPLEKKEDYKAAEEAVLSAVNSVYAAPIDQNEIHRINAQRFVLKWMTGTPDYTFDLGVSTMKHFKGSDELLAMYILGMAKFVLENPAKATDSKTVSEGSLLMLINYCENSDNHLKMTKGLKKMADGMKKSV